MSDKKNEIRYIIIAQNADDKLVLGTADKKVQFVRSAREILSDKDMLSKFSPEHASIIGVIAGMAIVENPPSI